MPDPEAIYNWRRLDDRITTSGQPTEPQLKDLRALGIRSSTSGFTAMRKLCRTRPERQPSRNDVHPYPGRFSESDRPGFRSILRRHGAVEGRAGARPLHRELPGFGLLLSVPPGCAWNGRNSGARRHGGGLAPRGRLGGVYRTLVLSNMKRSSNGPL